jgi:hypothetical protein
MGENYMKLQLHRVGLDGKGERRLTDPAFLHTVTLSPDAKYFVDVAETHDQAPVHSRHGRERKERWPSCRARPRAFQRARD